MAFVIRKLNQDAEKALNKIINKFGCSKEKAIEKVLIMYNDMQLREDNVKMLLQQNELNEMRLIKIKQKLIEIDKETKDVFNIFKRKKEAV